MKRLRLQDLSELIDVGKLSSFTGHCYKCNKILYKSEEEAREVGARKAAQGKGRTRPYKCDKPNVDGWHLTSLVKSKRPK